jgi:hypothetical protein
MKQRAKEAGVPVANASAELKELGDDIKKMVSTHDDLLENLGKKLARARDLARAEGIKFDDFLAQHCGVMSRSWAYKLISIGEGRITAAAYRAGIRDKMAEGRRKAKVEKAQLEAEAKGQTDDEAEAADGADAEVKAGEAPAVPHADVPPTRPGWRRGYLILVPDDFDRLDEVKEWLAQGVDTFGLKAEGVDGSEIFGSREQGAAVGADAAGAEQGATGRGAESDAVDAEQEAKSDANSAQHGAEATEMAKADDGLEIPRALDRRQEGLRHAA